MPNAPLSEDAARRLIEHVRTCPARHLPAVRSVYNARTRQLRAWVDSPAFPASVAGPITFSFLTRRKLTVTLFGEVHLSPRAPDACDGPVMPIHTFMAQWLRRVAVPVDVFLEVYYKDVPTEGGAGVYTVANEFRQCITDRASCTYDNVRFHGTDSRAPTVPYIAFVAIWMTPTVEQELQSVLREQTDNLLHVGSDETVAQLKEEWKARLLQALFAPTADYNFGLIADRRYSGEVQERVHRVRKNWIEMQRSLSVREADAVWDTMTSIWADSLSVELLNLLGAVSDGVAAARLKPDMTYKQRFVAVIGDTPPNSPIETAWLNMNVFFATALADMYTLARMLKTPNTSDDSDNTPRHIVYYGGLYHAAVYKAVFQRLKFNEVSSFGSVKRPRVCIPVEIIMPALNATGAAS